MIEFVYLIKGGVGRRRVNSDEITRIVRIINDIIPKTLLNPRLSKERKKKVN